MLPTECWLGKTLLKFPSACKIIHIQIIDISFAALSHVYWTISYICTKQSALVALAGLSLGVAGAVSEDLCLVEQPMKYL